MSKEREQWLIDSICDRLQKFDADDVTDVQELIAAIPEADEEERHAIAVTLVEILWPSEQLVAPMW